MPPYKRIGLRLLSVPRAYPAGDVLRAQFVVACLWGSFAGLLVRSFWQDAWVRHGGRLLIDCCTVALILLGAYKLFVESRRRDFSNRYLVAYVFLAPCVAAGMVGIAYNNPLETYALLGVLPFGGAACMALADNDELFSRVFKTILSQVYLGALYATYVLLFARPTNRFDWWGPTGENPASMASQCLYGLAFVVPYLHALPRRHAFCVAYAFIVYMALNFIGANRAPLLLFGLLIPCLLVIIAWRRHRSMATVVCSIRRLALVAVPFGVALGVAAPMMPDLMDVLEDRYSDNLARFTGQESLRDNARASFTGLLENSAEEFAGYSSRGGELRDFWAQIEAIDLVCGRGFGGRWTSPFWGTTLSTLHIGPGHLILVGGFPLVFCFFLVLVRVGRAAWRALPQSLAMPAVVTYGAMFFVSFLQHGPVLQDSGEVLVFWLSCGMAIAHGAGAVEARVAPYQRVLGDSAAMAA